MYSVPPTPRRVELETQGGETGGGVLLEVLVVAPVYLSASSEATKVLPSGNYFKTHAARRLRSPAGWSAGGYGPHTEFPTPPDTPRRPPSHVCNSLPERATGCCRRTTSCRSVRRTA